MASIEKNLGHEEKGSQSRTTRGFGDIHDGSLRAPKILYDDNNAAFEQIRINLLTEFPGSVQQLNKNDFNLARFCLETWPRTEISTE